MKSFSSERWRTKGSISKECYNITLLNLSNAFALESHNFLKHKVEARRHKVRMKMIFYYSTKRRLKTEPTIQQFGVVNNQYNKPGVLISSRCLISWLLFVCVLFSVSCSQQHCDIITSSINNNNSSNSQEETTRQQQERVSQELPINKQPSRTIIRSLPKEKLRPFTSDIRISRAANSSPLDWLNQDDLNQEHPSRSSISNSRQKFKRNNRPYFKERQAKRVIASRWQTEVFLPCQIENLDEEQTVSWIRKRDSLVLTIDKLKLIDDPRFQLAQNNQNWTLVLSQPTSQDAGFYECQVSSMEPKLSRVIELRMVEAISRISNFTSLFVRPNEVLNVTCFIEAPQDTDFVYWYKNKDPIQFDNLKLRRGTSSRRGQKDKERQFLKKKMNKLVKKSGNDSKTKNTFITAAESSPLHKQSNSKRFSSAKLVDESERQYLKRLNSSEQEIPENLPNLGLKQAGEFEEEKEGKENQEEKDDDDDDDDDHGDNDDDYEAEYEDETNNSNDLQDKRRRKQQHTQLYKSSSSLIIKQTQLNDTANYTCLPSNAKPSHISIYVIENGSQSQPEKRSLLAVDSACSHKYLLNYNWSLIKQIAFKLASSFNIHYYIFSSSVIDYNTISEDQNIVSLFIKLLGSQDLYRVMITLFLSIYLTWNWSKQCKAELIEQLI